jgi:hypothetical protein
VTGKRPTPLQLEAVAIAFEGEDLGVVYEPVDDGGGGDLVAFELG